MAISRILRVATLLGGVALFAPPAFAADQPASDAGARTIADFIAAYAGKASAPSIKVKAQGAGYLVTFDLAGAAGALKSTGFSYDSGEITLHVFQQDDGQWRVELADPPPITGHMTTGSEDNRVKVDVRVESEKLKQTALLDPKLNWIASGHGAVDKLRVIEHAPGIDEFIEFGKMRSDEITDSGAEDLTTKLTGPFESMSIVFDLQRKREDGTEGKNVHYAADGENGEADVSLAKFQPAPLLDAMRFFANHPEHADLQRDSDALKGIVTALVADHFTLDEMLKLDKLNLITGVGPVAIEGAGFAIGAANAGADTSFSERFSVKSIKLPDNVLPPAYSAIAPTAFEIGFKATGFNVEAAAQEWLADANFAGDGPPLDDEARRKVAEKLFNSRPIAIDIQPSRLVGPAIEINFEGKATMDMGQPTGSISIKLADFDKTAQAIHALGPDMEQKILPALAMAKGLGKPLADGSLLWVCALGRDHVIKINGLPLGKSPF